MARWISLALVVIAGCVGGDDATEPLHDASMPRDAVVENLFDSGAAGAPALDAAMPQDGLQVTDTPVAPGDDADEDAGTLDVPVDAAEPMDAAEPVDPPAVIAATCEPCAAREDCAEDHFCWPVNDSNRCLPLTDEDSYSQQCGAIGMDGRSLPDGTYFCRPLTGDCEEWLLLQ